jgi:hypothetical protein
LNRPNSLDTRDLGEVLDGVTRLYLDRDTIEDFELGTNLKRDVDTDTEESDALCTMDIVIVL